MFANNSVSQCVVAKHLVDKISSLIIILIYSANSLAFGFIFFYPEALYFLFFECSHERWLLPTYPLQREDTYVFISLLIKRTYTKKMWVSID